MDADVVVVGAGILGLASARAILRDRPTATVIVVDKEARIATHQSGRNSGVIHSGIYYPPDSAKASMVASGRRELFELCDRHRVHFELCGKVIVATTPRDLSALHHLHLRAERNAVPATLLDPAALEQHEPHARGLAALHVPSTGIVDYRAVCAALADDVACDRGQVLLASEVVAIDERADAIHVTTTSGEIHARVLVNCAGLQSDLVSDLAGVSTGGARIMAFRGEYHELVPERRGLVRNLIYPVPDPRFPFLGVHLSRAIDGCVHAGPNAVAALRREGYGWRDIDPDEVRTLLASPATRALARAHWRTGAAEVVRSVSRTALVRALRRLVPDLGPEDLRPAGSGVRAQAVAPDGRLLDDFVFADSARVVSVVNAPSPGATASLEIGRTIAHRVSSRLV